MRTGRELFKKGKNLYYGENGVTQNQEKAFEFFRDAVLSASYNFNLVNGSWRLLGKGIQNNNKIEGGPNFGLGYFQLGLFTYF